MRPVSRCHGTLACASHQHSYKHSHYIARTPPLTMNNYNTTSAVVSVHCQCRYCQPGIHWLAPDIPWIILGGSRVILMWCGPSGNYGGINISHTRSGPLMIKLTNLTAFYLFTTTNLYRVLKLKKKKAKMFYICLISNFLH